MGNKDNWLEALPEQFRNQVNIEAIIQSYAEQLEEVAAMFRQLSELRSFDASEGAQLDGIGDIVVLSRPESALYAGIIDFDVIDDERYRLFLKYKAMRNSSRCTFPELVAACKLLYKAEVIYYREIPAYPATFFLNIGVQMSDDLLAMLRKSHLTIKSAGVQANVGYFNLRFFGFSDTNRYAQGFGMAPFAQQIIRPEEYFGFSDTNQYVLGFGMGPMAQSTIKKGMRGIEK